jgi:peptidoglycan hydrolase-like protein with peptidoglycan-binding domain
VVHWLRQLQQRLKDKGFNPGTIDGVFGLGTKSAVRAFQKANDLGGGWELLVNKRGRLWE